MKNKKLNKSKYNGLGFVEALIAIMVSGVVATVLINISASSMRDLVRQDVEDAQANYARSYAVILQNIANEDKVETEEDEFDLANVTDGLCYRLVDVNADDTEKYILELEASNRDDYKTTAVLPMLDGTEDEGDFFGLVCIEAIQDDTSPKLLVEVTIGFNKTKGDFTTASDIKDYKYLAIINL